MTRSSDILTASAILHRQHSFGNHLPGIRSHDMDAQDPIRFRVTEELHHTFRLQVGFCAGVGAKGETPRSVFDALFFQLGFVLPYPRDFRVSVHDGRDGVVVDVTVALGDVFDGGDGLFFGFVREHGAEGAVADNADVWVFGAVLFVDDEPAFGVDVKVDVFQAEAGGVRASADGDKDGVCFELKREKKKG